MIDVTLILDPAAAPRPLTSADTCVVVDTAQLIKKSVAAWRAAVNSGTAQQLSVGQRSLARNGAAEGRAHLYAVRCGSNEALPHEERTRACSEGRQKHQGSRSRLATVDLP